MVPKDWSALQYWSQKPVCEVCMQKSLFGDRLHITWEETTQQRGSAMYLRLGFTRANTTASWFRTHRFEFPTLTFISPEEPSCPATQENLRQVACILILHSDTSFYPWRQSMHFSNLCSEVHTTSSQHVCSWRHLLFLKLKCFWWGIQVHQLSKSLEQDTLY